MSLADDILTAGHQCLRQIGGTVATWRRAGIANRACTVTLAPALDDLMGDGASLSDVRRLTATVGADEISDPQVNDEIHIASVPHAGIWTVRTITERTGAAAVCTVEWRKPKLIGEPAALRRGVAS